MILRINNSILTLILLIILFPFCKIYPQIYQNQSQLSVVNPKVLINENQISDNPALLHFIENNYACFSYTISKFGLKEISPVFADAGMKLSDNWYAAISLYSLGDELYNEFAMMFISSLKITEKIIAGGGFEYIRMSIKDFYSDFNLQYHFGTVLIISKELTAGFSFKNFTRSYFEGGENTANQIATAGICFSPASNISTEFAGIVRIGTQSGFLVHFFYEPFEIIALRISYATAPKLFNLGLRINTLDWFNLSFNLQYHSNLGYTHTPAISILW